MCSRLPEDAPQVSACRWSCFLLYFSAGGCFSSLPAVSLAHACCCAPVHVGAHALPPILLLACVPTGSGLAVSSCSRSLAPPGDPCPAQLAWAHAHGGRRRGLAVGLTLTRCGRHHPSRALTCSLIPGSGLLALAVGLTRARPGSCSLTWCWAHAHCLLWCPCTHMAHLEGFTPFGRGSSSSSRRLLPQWDRDRERREGKEGKGREGCFPASGFSQAGSAGAASSPRPLGVPQAGRGPSKVQHWVGPCSAQFREPLQPQSRAVPGSFVSSPPLLLLFLLLSSSSPALAPLLLPTPDRTPPQRRGSACRRPPGGDRLCPSGARPVPASWSPNPDCCCRRRLAPWPVCLPVRWRPSLTDSCPCSEYNLPNSLFFRYLQICATVSNFSSTKRPFQLLPN